MRVFNTYRFLSKFMPLVLLSACSEDFQQNLSSTNTSRTVAEAGLFGAALCGALSHLSGGSQQQNQRAAAQCAAVGGAAGVLIANEQGRLAREEVELRSAIGSAETALNDLRNANAALQRDIDRGIQSQANLRRQIAALEAAQRERARLESLRPAIRKIGTTVGNPETVIAGLGDQIERGLGLIECLRTGTCVG